MKAPPLTPVLLNAPDANVIHVDDVDIRAGAFAVHATEKSGVHRVVFDETGTFSFSNVYGNQSGGPFQNLTEIVENLASNQFLIQLNGPNAPLRITTEKPVVGYVLVEKVDFAKGKVVALASDMPDHFCYYETDIYKAFNRGYKVYQINA